MCIKIGIIIDNIKNINPDKDSSIAIALEAQIRGYNIYYIKMQDLYLYNNQARSYIRKIKINLDKLNWYILNNIQDVALTYLDVILIRKNPPVNSHFIYATYILEHAEKQGTLIINKPKSLRDFNEKLFTIKFHKFIPSTLVTNNMAKILSFINKKKDTIIKPLNQMGGNSVFRIRNNDTNKYVIIENITKNGRIYCIIQKYLSAIKKGDKRILVVNGNPIPYCLLRIPKKGEHRANLAVGGLKKIKKINIHDIKIVKEIQKTLKKHGLIFVGLDIIGNKLTEINITSPTGIKEIEAKIPRLSISGILMNIIEKKIFFNKKRF